MCVCVCVYAVCIYVRMLNFFNFVSNKSSKDPCVLLFPRIFHTVFTIIKALIVSLGVLFCHLLGRTLSQAVSRRLSPRRLEFISRAVNVGFVVYPVVLVQFFLRVIWFFLSKCSFHKRSIFIRLSFRCCTLGPLEAAVHPKNNKQLLF